MTTTRLWREVLEIACMRQQAAYDLVRETVELHGPTHHMSAVAYAHWLAACEQATLEEREYQVWLKGHRRARV